MTIIKIKIIIEGEKMKKIFGFVLVLLASILLVGCSDPESKVIKIQFVPSQDASIISTQAPILEELLEAEMPGYTFEISTGTDYNAVLEGMLSGQIQVGFLTAQQYAGISINDPGKVEPILTSVRDKYQVQDDYTTYEDQIKAMNGEVPGYNYLGQQSVNKTNNYNSICIVLKDSPINTVVDLKGKICATQKTSSGAGYVYPSVLLDSFSMKFVNSTSPDASKGEVGAQTVSGYPAAIQLVLDGDVDAAWIFLDARYSAYYNNSSSGKYYKDYTGSDKANIFELTKVVGMTTGIYNDTISVVSTMKKSVKSALQEAFINIAKTEAGYDALYKIYSHTGYMKATDADYEGERTVYRFKESLN